MFSHERHKELLALLERKRRASITDLLEALRVSPATLRRDLADLEAEGRLVRFHGGAAHPAFVQGEPSFEQRSREGRAEKVAMGAAAAELVPAQQTVFLDAGTSCLEVGRHLLPRSDLTIITNSVSLAAMARESAARIIALGGEVRGVTGATVGALAMSWLENLRADWAFVGASGLFAEGACTTELSEAAMKQAYLRRAGCRVLVADASKWNAGAPVRFAGWSEVDTWITAGDLPRDAATAVAAQGPRILRAKS